MMGGSCYMTVEQFRGGGGEGGGVINKFGVGLEPRLIPQVIENPDIQGTRRSPPLVK